MEKELLEELKETDYQLDQYRLLTNKLINQNVSQYNIDKFIEDEYIQDIYKNIKDYEYDLYNWLSPDLLDEVSNELIRLETQLKKQKEIINKINNYLDNYDVFKVFSFPLMKKWEEQEVKSSIEYEFKTSLIKDLKKILEDKEV